ncbi:MAG: hypothetical protein HC783_05805 [Rhodobacteraceae bacterium]|nr:hypothetical protein [Paracoccaceae bacterium]
MTISIRRATSADAERVADIARRNFTETFGHLYPPEDLAQFLRTSYIAETQREALVKELDALKASLDRERAVTQALDAENKEIEAALITEEQDLTTRRATLPADEFAALATAFDVKVERIRAEQDAKFRNLSQGREEDRKAFLRAIVPVLGDLMGEKRAVVILENPR